MNLINADEIYITAWPPQPLEGTHTGEVPQGVRVEHIPTGTEIIVCKERHQYQNRALALQALHTILFT